MTAALFTLTSTTIATAAPAPAPGMAAAPAAATHVTAAHPAATTPPTLRPGHQGQAVKAVQTRLNTLGYWCGPADGRYGPATAQAVMALQKVTGLPRTGILDARTRAKLNAGTRPGVYTKRGHVIEVDKRRQVMMVADNGVVKRIYNVSTGTEKPYTNPKNPKGPKPIAHTPTGTFRVRWTVPGWEKGPLGSLYKSHYLTNVIAIHGVPSPAGVGAQPASHGCVRVTTTTMDELVRSKQIAKNTLVLVY